MVQFVCCPYYESHWNRLSYHDPYILHASVRCNFNTTLENTQGLEFLNGRAYISNYVTTRFVVWNRIFLKNLTIAHLVEKFPALIRPGDSLLQASGLYEPDESSRHNPTPFPQDPLQTILTYMPRSARQYVPSDFHSNILYSESLGL